MDKSSNAKQLSKKSQMAVDKSKKSASKKKKKNKKSTSAKSDQSPDSLEVEGVRTFDQPGAESDSSSTRIPATLSPTLSQKSSIAPDPEPKVQTSSKQEVGYKTPPAKSSPSNSNDIASNQTTPKPAKRSPQESPVVLKPTNSTDLVSDKEINNKKGTVSFSNFEDIQTISATLSNMSVKSKNGSQRNKTKNNSKSGSNGATKREKTKAEPVKSCINRAAEAAARLKSEESLRWEFALEDDEAELERIKIYKMNRRKRYLAAAQEKGLGWVVNYGSNGSPLLDDPSLAGSDYRDRDILHASVTNFSTVKSLMPSQSSTPLGSLVS